MIRTLALIGACVISAAPALANDYDKVTEKSDFLSLVDGRDLRIGLYNLTLSVLPDGRIQGSAMGWDITGTWSWQDGYFCREMDWSGKAIDYNCQLVEVHGGDKMRFTVDRGAGKSASFRLR
ncbi:MAG: dihydrodipicolinate reductase [Tabrizicola sp.]|nr:dihydrodipicolinate reductase [Tabrizicola sp.]